MTPVPLLPLESFFRESLAFLGAHNYLLAAELVAMEEATGLEDLRNDYRDLERHTEYCGGATSYLVARLFISYVAAFEVFLQDTVCLVIGKHPKKVGSAALTLSDVLDAGSTEHLVQRAADEAVNKMMYKKPAAYLQELCDFLSIDAKPLSKDWRLFTEAKARRDLGVHNAWRCNGTYLRKLREAAIPTSARAGDVMLPLEQTYVEQLIDAMNRLVQPHLQ